MRFTLSIVVLGAAYTILHLVKIILLPLLFISLFIKDDFFYQTNAVTFKKLFVSFEWVSENNLGSFKVFGVVFPVISSLANLKSYPVNDFFGKLRC